MKSPAFLFQRLTKSSIRRRLALGYLLTIAIAATGIQIGQRWASHRVREPAQQQLEAAYKYSNLLNELQKNLSDTRGLILAYIQRPALLDSYSYHLIDKSQQLQGSLDALETEYLLEKKRRKSPSPSVKASLQPASDPDDLRLFLSTCKDVGSNYEQALNDLFESIETDRALPKSVTETVETSSRINAQAATNALKAISSIVAVESETNAQSAAELASDRAAQMRLLAFLQAEPAERLNRCVLALEPLAFQNQSDILRASLQQETAIRLQSRITNITLLLSLFAAIALALYSSWSITRPLTNVSRVAHQVSQNSNFDVQIPVETNDEVGLLAASLNNLIHRVRLLLKEQKAAQQKLETYNQTLESAVQARSQEILQKNNSLEKMVQNLHETQSQLVQAEKMSSLGQLVAGIAHEINNPVNFIHGNLKHADAYFKDLLEIVALYQTHDKNSEVVADKAEEIDIHFLAEDATKLLKSMRIGTERIREIVLSLRNFSRLDEADSKTVHLHDGIDSTLLILGHRLKETTGTAAVEVIKEYGDLPPIDCFPGQLNQVFMNILANAVDAFEKTNNKTKGRSPQITIATQQIGDRVRVAIADNGSGIPEAIKQRIFEPFFTTKEVGKGTGMGLPISYKIVTERHQGQLTCESVQGEGTTFTIELPIKRSA